MKALLDTNLVSLAMSGDPGVLRGFIEVASLLELAVDVLARPGVAERAVALADPAPPPGPDRAELLTLVDR